MERVEVDRQFNVSTTVENNSHTHLTFFLHYSVHYSHSVRVGFAFNLGKMANIKFNSKKPLKQISKNILFYTSGHKGRIVFNVCPCDYLILSLSVKCDVTIFTSYTISHRLTIIHMETAHFKVLI